MDWIEWMWKVDGKWLWKVDSGAVPDLTHIKKKKEHTQHCYAVDSSISPKVGTEFNHVTADTLQTFKVKGLKVKVKVTVKRNVSAVKTSCMGKR